jgi:hypothetical protein
MRWVDELPPPAGRSRHRHDHNLIAAALREQPGRWAMLPDLPVSHTASISSGVNAAYRPAGEFEAVSRNGVLYARYQGRGLRR